MSQDCSGGHCDDHASTSLDAHVSGHNFVELSGDATHDPDEMAHDGCDQFLCHALDLTLPQSKVTFDHSKTVLGWRVRHLSTLNEPENPDRPPNL